MGRVEWTWNRAIPSTFLLTLLVLGVIAAALLADSPSGTRTRVNGPRIAVAIVVVAGEARRRRIGGPASAS